MKERILDVARFVKNILNRFSTAEVAGVPIDWFFHLCGAMLIAWVASAFLPRKRVLQVGVALILAKELFDVFAKTRMEYIRPPEADIALDIASGVAGLFLGFWLAKRAPLPFARKGNR
ncbi:MAG TPA: hypothetical protein P5571_12330 [Candidatus Krumholzibacteria bacterium]|nr:hypothetical protein [Candidatus Krumholzibacteria bacterium]HRX52147.1 hypothetical protein [Candidatus Krumholzibacteria bacterium]